ncbi:ABC transporter permease [Roseiconus nitratireducens]|uniref:Transport permease protein n=2 Tax=Roseiconus nitratireducens TaxID=2605748 RepID=A0A5M6DCW0_9BACT|nr:ABC transporter permease [Roseiconus nitratireducens]
MGTMLPDLREVWRYRDLLMLLAWRDISAKFRQSIIGYGWAIARPLLTAIIYTLVFHFFVRIDTAPIPYTIFAFAGLIPWMYFSNSLSLVTGSVVGGGGMLTKVYFPRLVLPLSTVAVGLIEVTLQLGVLGLLMVWYQYVPGIAILCLPLFVGVTLLTTLAFGIWLTALNVKYRDVAMAVPFLIQTWMYLCPIIYPSSVVPERFRAIYALNPMVGVIEGFRWCLIGSNPPDWTMMTISMVAMIVILLGGMFYFRKVETTFADII